MSAYNFGVRGCSPTKLWNLTCLKVGVFTQIQLLMASFPQYLGGQKTIQN